jgi:exoribonuclease II
MNPETLRFPIGKMLPKEQLDFSNKLNWLNDISEFPKQLIAVAKSLNEAQLNTPYRDGGWTVKQVVHHLADSHTNAYIRMKLALTSNNPTIIPYNQDEWAKLIDYGLPIEISLQLLTSIHLKWVTTAKQFTETDWQKTFIHPEYKITVTLAEQAY